jgi:hypothetical protein
MNILFGFNLLYTLNSSLILAIFFYIPSLQCQSNVNLYGDSSPKIE